MKKLYIALFGLVASTLFCSIVLAEEPQRTIKIGAVLGLTGPASVWAHSVLDGLNLAADEASQDHAKPRFEVIVEDSRTDAKGAVLAYKKLVDVDKVDVVIGDVWDFITTPLVALADQGKKPLISPTVVDASIEARSPYFFTLGCQIKLVRNAVDHFFAINPDIHTAAIIFWDDPWGKAYLKEWKDAAAAHHVTILSEIGVHDWGADYRTEVARTVAKGPDALLAPHNLDRILRRLGELKSHPKILTTSNVLEVLANGEIPYEVGEGVFFTELAAPDEFIRKFEAKYHRLPIIEAQNGYDAFRAAYLAVSESPEAPLTALVKMKFNGVTGPIDFTAGESANFTEASLREVKGGKIITVK